MTEPLTVGATYRKGRLIGDYRGAHVLLEIPGRDSCVVEVTRVEYREGPPSGYFATLQHFNGEPVIGSWNMGSLRFLNRCWEDSATPTR